jgi:hypothetical protein
MMIANLRTATAREKRLRLIGARFAGRMIDPLRRERAWYVPTINTFFTITFFGFYLRGTRLARAKTGGPSMVPPGKKYAPSSLTPN